MFIKKLSKICLLRVFLYAAISDYPSSLQSTTIAIIPAKIPAAIPSARIIGTAAAELEANVADEEVDVEVKVELVTTLGVLDEVNVDVDTGKDEDVTVVGATLTGIESLAPDEIPEVEVDGVSVLREVVSVTMPVSVGVLELKNK